MYPQGVRRIRKPAYAGLRMRYIFRFSNRRLGAKNPLSSRRRFIQSFLRKYSVLSLPDATVLTSRIKSPRARDSW